VLGVGVYNQEWNRFREKDSRYIVFDPELLAQKRAQYCEIPEKLNEMKNEGFVA
jgi:hypothetical protein